MSQGPIRYEDFSIRFAPPVEGIYPTQIAAPDSANTRGSFAPPELDDFDAEASGRRLFQALFQGPTLRLFYQASAKARERGSLGLRIRLIFEATPDGNRLTALPWELLFDDDHFLALRRFSPIVRSVDTERGVASGPWSPPLGILAAFAQPIGTIPLDLDAECRAIEKAWKPLTGVHPEVLEATTREKLRTRLLDKRSHILHFTGHGNLDSARSEGVVLFEGEAAAADAVTARELRDLLGDIASLRLIVLSACLTAGVPAEQSFKPFTSVASALLREGFPAVLAMQKSISDRVALVFGAKLYERLAQGDPLEAAVAEARGAVRATPGSETEWATPILFVQGADGDRFPEPEDAAAPGAIQSQILDASRLIADKTEGFVGRRWLFASVDQFLARETRGYFVLRGDPGIGKSAFLAKMVQERGYVHHFNVRADRINRPELALASLCAQVIARHGLRYTFLPPEAAQNSQFLCRLLEEAVARLPQGERAVLVVDALDEVDPAALAANGNVLSLPSHLPPRVYLVLTQRRMPIPLRVDDCPLFTLDLEQDSDGNVADVREFVEAALGRPGIRIYLATQRLEEATFVLELVDKSQGNFMYLRHVLPEIEKGAYQDRAFATLPAGLANYYEDHWQRMKDRDRKVWTEEQLPVLVALTVIPEAVPIDLLQEFSGLAERRRIRTVLRDWDAFLYRGEVEPGIQGYRLYHESFFDFIAAKEEILDERVDLKEAHRRIARLLEENP